MSPAIITYVSDSSFFINNKTKDTPVGLLTFWLGHISLFSCKDPWNIKYNFITVKSV